MVKGLRKCPFCGSKHDRFGTFISNIKTDNPRNAVALYHYCNPDPTELGTVITVYGATEQECIKRWNNDKKHTSNE